MSATLYFGGIRINVPTNELAEAVRQLLLLEGASSSQAPSATLPTQRRNVELDISTEKRTDKDVALALLKVIDDHKLSGGAPIGAVMAVLGASHAKGVGSKTAIANKALDKLGFAIPDVYTNDRDSFGMRNWKPGPRFADALRALTPQVELVGFGPEEEEEDTQ